MPSLGLLPDARPVRLDRSIQRATLTVTSAASRDILQVTLVIGPCLWVHTAESQRVAQVDETGGGCGADDTTGFLDGFGARRDARSALARTRTGGRQRAPSRMGTGRSHRLPCRAGAGREHLQRRPRRLRFAKAHGRFRRRQRSARRKADGRRTKPDRLWPPLSMDAPWSSGGRAPSASTGRA